MAAKPTRYPRWAWSAAPGGIVEPPAGTAGAGWLENTRPPAPFFNYLFNTLGVWVDYLRGPHIESWTRTAWNATLLDTDVNTFVGADEETADNYGSNPFYRYLIGGQVGAAPALRASVRGGEWAVRTSLGAATGVLRGCRYFAGIGVNAGSWWVWGTTGAPAAWLSQTPPGDDATSGVGSNGGTWTPVALPAGAASILALAQDPTHGTNGHLVAARQAGGLALSTDAAHTVWSSATGAIAAILTEVTDVIWTGAEWIALANNGNIEVYSAAVATDPWPLIVTLAGTAAIAPYARLATDGDGRAVIWPQYPAAGNAVLRYSDDGGVTWTTLAAVVGLRDLTALRYEDGTWIASSRLTPYLWTSDDLITWTPLPLPLPLYVDANTYPVYDVIYADGRWIATGNGWTYTSGRARDAAPGAWIPGTVAPYLANAGYLRGYIVASNVPVVGQVLTWNAVTGWTPAAGTPGPAPSGTGVVEVVGGVTTDPARPWDVIERAQLVEATYAVVGPTAIVTIPIADDATTYIECEGDAKETAAGRSGYWKLIWAVRRNGGGGPAAVNGDLVTQLVGSIDAGGASPIDLDMDIDANTVRILATGIAGVDVRFGVHYRYRVVALA